MAAGDIAHKANRFIREHRRTREAARRLSAPARAVALPVLVGKGRGLRLRTGPSTLMRVVSTVEGDVEATLLDLLGDGDTVYDIGANVGWFSLLAARTVGSRGRVVAFEPSLANASLLERNATVNGFDNISVIPAAVGDRDGWASFSNASSLKGKLQDAGEAQVPILSLDAWLTETGEKPPEVLKVDVEGAEAAVLRGMRQTLHTHKPALIIELHDTNTEVADLLDEAGYRHQPIDHGASTRDAPWWVHVLAQR